MIKSVSKTFNLTTKSEILLPALILSCSSSIGISSLTLPGSVEKTGVLLWPLLLFLAAFLNYFSNKMLAKTARLTGSSSYSEMCQKVLKKFKIIPDILTLISNTCLVLSCNITWVTFLSDLVYIYKGQHSSNLMKAIYILIPNLCLLPVLLKKNMKDVAIPATVTILAVIFLLLFVIFTFSAKLYHLTVSASNNNFFAYKNLVLADISMVPQTLCLLLFSCSYQQNIIDLSQDLKKKIYSNEDIQEKESTKDSFEKSINSSEILSSNLEQKSNSEILNCESLIEISQNKSSNNLTQETLNQFNEQRSNLFNDSCLNEVIDEEKSSEEAHKNTKDFSLTEVPTTSNLPSDIQQKTGSNKKEKLVFKMIKTILMMENLFKAIFFFCIGMLGYFSFCEKRTLYKANILALYKHQNSLVVYVNVIMAICVMTTAIFIFKPAKDTIMDIIKVIRPNVMQHKLSLYCTLGLQSFIVICSILLVLNKVSFIKLISIISFYISPFVSIYMPVLMYAKVAKRYSYFLVVLCLMIVTFLTIWL